MESTISDSIKGHGLQEDDIHGAYSGKWSEEPRFDEDGGEDVGVDLDNNQNTRATN